MNRANVNMDRNCSQISFRFPSFAGSGRSGNAAHETKLQDHLECGVSWRLGKESCYGKAAWSGRNRRQSRWFFASVLVQSSHSSIQIQFIFNWPAYFSITYSSPRTYHIGWHKKPHLTTLTHTPQKITSFYDMYTHGKHILTTIFHGNFRLSVCAFYVIVFCSERKRFIFHLGFLGLVSLPWVFELIFDCV